MTPRQTSSSPKPADRAAASAPSNPKSRPNSRSIQALDVVASPNDSTTPVATWSAAVNSGTISTKATTPTAIPRQPGQVSPSRTGAAGSGRAVDSPAAIGQSSIVQPGP